MKTQKEAIFLAITSVLADSNDEIIEGNKVELSKEQRAAVSKMVTAQILAGEVAFTDNAKAKHPTEKDVLKYVSSMLGNWLTRDLRLNGGVKYEPKNKGSRTGQSDDIMKNLKKLHKKLSAHEQSPEIAAKIAQVDKAIEDRKAAILAARGAQTAPVDWSVLEEAGMDFSDLKASLEGEASSETAGDSEAQ